ncbi:MAG: hypothetical protein INR65_01875 [Gluconacetobacter diazotrophicus]|nr:hypothetical protein [Gluconacetobacter diazotrophicus]
MLAAFRAYLRALHDHRIASTCICLAVCLTVAATFAEPDWSRGLFLAGAAAAHAVAGFAVWRQERSRAE